MDSLRPDSGSSPQDDSQIIQDILAKHANQKGSLLPILHAVQDTIGHIPESALPQIAAGIQRSRAEIHGVVHFYPHFRTTPPARTHIEICRAESCQACGANALYEHAQEHIQAQPADQLSLAPVFCLGLCAQSPAVLINGQPHAHVSPQKLDALLAPQEI